MRHTIRLGIMVLAALLEVLAVSDWSQGASAERVTFQHHFIDTTLPVYEPPN